MAERTLIAGVGYNDLGDFSFGPILVARLAHLASSAVAVEDLGYNPVAAVDWLRDQAVPFDRAIVIGAAERGRAPGALDRGRWAFGQHTAADVQGSVAEAVTGIVSLDNLLVITEYFGVLPARTTVLDLEPVESGWQGGLSPLVEERAAQVVAWISDAVSSGVEAARGANAMGAA